MDAYIKNKKLKTNKTNEVLRHLKTNGSITSMEAFSLYGATRLSAIIFVLRKKGYNIVNSSKIITDRYGSPCRFVEYILKENEDED